MLLGLIIICGLLSIVYGVYTKRRGACTHLCAAVGGFLFHQLADVTQQSARLRRQLVERTPQNFRRKLVRQRDVIERDFNKALPVGKCSRLPLVLVEQARWRQ